MQHRVTVIAHAEGEDVYCWTKTEAVDLVRSCLRVHPSEEISVRTVYMTAEQFDAMDDYDGEC